MAPVNNSQGSSLFEEYGLDAIARHNASIETPDHNAYHEVHNGLGIYHGELFSEDQSLVHIPPTPRSIPEPDGVRTRSGRSTGRNDSPFSTTKSRASKSPASRTKKEKKSRVLEKSKTPKLTAPLSILTKDMTVPVKDMDAWVNRSAEVRREEAEKRHGYVTRPMNSFMLYRSAYADRTKQWATQNNHQVVSSVAGESWPMEPDEVRNQFNEWAKIERANHAAAHPEYKFSPSKATAKKRKGEFSDDEDDDTDLDGDPDGEYRAGGRSSRRRPQPREVHEDAYLNRTVGFDSNPYYAQHGYEIPQYAFASNDRIVPSNVAYDVPGIMYNPQTGTYMQSHVAPQHPKGYSYMPHEVRIATPASQQDAQSLGGFGLPGQMPSDDFFGGSRTGTPATQIYSQYCHPTYQGYQPYSTYHQPVSAAHQQQLYEHQQYLQAAAQPQAAIDPGLETAFASGAMASAHHFDEAIGNINGDLAFAGMPEYFEDLISPNSTFVPKWEQSAANFGGR